MYAIRGGWIGQTFAMATTSDSGGRKSRIRRSKEERKAMVESFIQRYQSSNDGNFPSLNLTHKEVGGSFYIVREIVREIIQENRVLGPARYSPEVDHDDTFMTKYPLGSIAAEPQGLLLHKTEGLNVISEHQEKEMMEFTLDGNGHYINHQEPELLKSASEQHIDEIVEYPNTLISNHVEDTVLKSSSNGVSQCHGDDKKDTDGIMDGAKTNELSDETCKGEAVQLPMYDILEAGKELAMLGASNAQSGIQAEEVVVEIFPVRLANTETDDIARSSTESGNLSGNLNDSKTIQVELSDGKTGAAQNSLIISSDQVITEGKDSSESSIIGEGSIVDSELEVNGKVFQKAEGEVIIAAIDVSESPLILEGTSVLTDCTHQLASHDGIVSETFIQPDVQPNDVPAEAVSLEDSNVTSMKSNDREPHVVALNRIDLCRDNKVVAGSPSLDRINLQSWEKATSKQHPNPLLAVLKAVADAFVKFWS